MVNNAIITDTVNELIQRIQIPPLIELHFQLPNKFIPYNMLDLKKGFWLESIDNPKRVLFDEYIFIPKYHTQMLVDLIQNPVHRLNYDLESNKGQTLVAEYLASNKVNKKQKALCLLWALMNDMLNGNKMLYPDKWRGQPFEWFSAIQHEVNKGFPDANMFHHAMRNKLPIGFTSWDIDEVPKDIHYMAVELYSKLNELNNEYMLVHFSAPVKEWNW